MFSQRVADNGTFTNIHLNSALAEDSRATICSSGFSSEKHSFVAVVATTHCKGVHTDTSIFLSVEQAKQLRDSLNEEIAGIC